MKARRALRIRKYFPGGSDVVSPLASSGKKYRMAAGAMVPVVVSTKEEIDVDAELRTFDIGLKEGNPDQTVPVRPGGFRMKLRHVGWIVVIAVIGGLLWFLATTFWQLFHMM